MDNAAHVLFGPSTQCQGELMAVMCHKKPYNEKNNNNNNNKNNKQNINKQSPTCTCPSINKLTAGALVICKRNRYAHWQVQNTGHRSQVQVFALLINNWDKQLTIPPPPTPLVILFTLASTGSDITIQLANFFFLTCSSTFWQNYISGIFKIMILGG